MMYAVVAHSKLDLTIQPYVTCIDIGPKVGKSILSFREAKKRQRTQNRRNPSFVHTIFQLIYCDQNKEE